MNYRENSYYRLAEHYWWAAWRDGEGQAGWGMARQKGRTGQNHAEGFKYLLRLMTPKGLGSEVAWRARRAVLCTQPPPYPHPNNARHCSENSLVPFSPHLFIISRALCSFPSPSRLSAWLFTIAYISQIWEADTCERLFFLKAELRFGNRRVVLYYSNIVFRLVVSGVWPAES